MTRQGRCPLLVKSAAAPPNHGKRHAIRAGSALLSAQIAGFVGRPKPGRAFEGLRIYTVYKKGTCRVAPCSQFRAVASK